MVISVNNEPNKIEFQTLLGDTLDSLKSESIKHSKKYLGLVGSKLENEVFDILNYNSKGTIFEGSIELVSGQKFPDIVAKKYYGVEVKTTKSNQWKSTGSSIAEGTRVDGVERIFMLFGKMVSPVEFMCKPYEECLSEVVVTHSPRYLIDMKLAQGQTIFDKINIPYNDLRKQDNPIKTILDYYKKQLKTGDTVWWLDQESTQNSNLIIRVWNNLSIGERKGFMVKGYSYFPEIVSKKGNKFNDFAVWLSARQAIVCPNVRDIFSSAGQGEIVFKNIIYPKIPKVVIRLIENIEFIKKEIFQTENQLLSEFWGLEVEDENKLKIWFELVSENLKWITEKNPVIVKALEEKLFA